MKTNFKRIVYVRVSILFIFLSLCSFFYSKIPLDMKRSFNSFNEVKAFQANKQNIELVHFSSPYHFKSWYVIQLGNVPVGVLTVGINDTSSGLPSDYYAQFASRVGYSPFLSIIKGNLNKSKANQLELTQKLLSKNESGIFQESENRWLEENNKFVLLSNKGATLQGLFPINIPSQETSKQLLFETNLFYNKTRNENKANKILVPFTGTFAPISNLSLKYDSDNFLQSANLPIEENITLNFKRITESQYSDYLKSLPETLIDFGWLSSIKPPKNELNHLTDTLDTCISQTHALNKLVIKNIPQSSYLSYRKLINISNFCVNTKDLLFKNKDKNYFEISSLLSSQIKKIVKEDHLELPISITNSPDLTVFYNDTIYFLWPKITSQFIYNSIEEIKDNFELEKNRKSLLGVQININSLQPRSVVRADIKLIEPTIVFTVERADNPLMSSDSIFNLSNAPEGKFFSYLINGQYFSKNQNINLNLLCEKNKGKLGIDLGDAPQIIVNSGRTRGIWDINTRIYVAREFALKTASTKSCRQIIFRTPEKMTVAVNNELESFKNSVISSDNEILLSNNVQKRLLVMPGKYKMTTTSLVTGAVISTHEFNVEPGTNTEVSAKAN